MRQRQLGVLAWNNPDTLQVPSLALLPHRHLEVWWPHRLLPPWPQRGTTSHLTPHLASRIIRPQSSVPSLRSSATHRTCTASPLSPLWPPGTTSARQESCSGRLASGTWADGALLGPPLWKHPLPQVPRGHRAYLLGLYSSAPTSSLACSRSKMPAADPPPSFFTLALRAGLVSVSMCSEPSSEESSLCCGDRVAGRKRTWG